MAWIKMTPEEKAEYRRKKEEKLRAKGLPVPSEDPRLLMTPEERKADLLKSMAEFEEYERRHSPVQIALDNVGWTVEKQIRKNLELQEAKHVKTFCFQGEIKQSEEMSDNTTQVKAVDQMNKIMGLYAPEQHEVSGVENFTLNIITGREAPKHEEPQQAVDAEAQ